MPPAHATVLILDLPPKTFIGIDLLSFDSSPDFQGVSGLPPQLHFLYSGTDASLSIRHGRWLNTTTATTAAGGGSAPHVFKWDTSTETLEPALLGNAAIVVSSATSSRRLVDYSALQDATSDLQAKQAETTTVAAAAAAAVDADDNDSMGPDWPRLTSHVTPALLDRVLPRDWLISSVSAAPSDTETIPGLSHLDSSNVLDQLPLRPTAINLKQTWDGDDVGRTRTERARDRSWYLAQLIESISGTEAEDEGKRDVGARELLGELQLCFAMVLTLANHSCLEQWKRLLEVLLTCQTALREWEGYFVAVVRVLERQMRHVEDVEGGLFDLRDETGSSWLRRVWRRFRASVDEVFPDPGEGKKLKGAVASLQRFLEENYGWQNERDMLRRGMVELEDGERVEVAMDGADEDEERGEYAPVVVEL